jgi:hypothetical protein
MGPSEISSGDANNTSTERAWADADRMPPDARKASLHILRTALRMLTAPPQPHADDLMQMEIAKKVCARFFCFCFFSFCTHTALLFFSFCHLQIRPLTLI